jgi:hypothetical protein
MWGYVAERALNFYIFARRMRDPLLRVSRMPFLMRTAADLYARPLDLDSRSIE